MLIHNQEVVHRQDNLVPSVLLDRLVGSRSLPELVGSTVVGVEGFGGAEISLFQKIMQISHIMTLSSLINMRISDRLGCISRRLDRLVDVVSVSGCFGLAVMCLLSRDGILCKFEF